MKKLIKYLAKKFLTEDDFGVLIVDSLEEVNRSKEENEIMFTDIRKIEGYQEYLTNTMMSDVKRYFAASSPVEQLQIKGAYTRTSYLRSKLREIGEAKLTSPRHA